MMVKKVSDVDLQRPSCAWRYFSPSIINSQDRRRAFELRTKKDGSLEEAVSFDANTDSTMSLEDKRAEIYNIYDRKHPFTTSKTGRFMMFDLIAAQRESNFSEERIRAVIDGKTHCSLFYMNGCYDSQFKMVEVLGSLYNNLIDDVPTVRVNHNQIAICKN